MRVRRRDVEADAQDIGYTVTRGDYHGTADNRADRWYIERADAKTGRRVGIGFATLKDVRWELKVLRRQLGC